MSAHNLPAELHNAQYEIVDPGTGAAIIVDRWNLHIPLTIAASAAETNTLAAPARAGQKLSIIAVSVGSSGSRVITVASAYDQAGGTTLTFDAVDERVVLESYEVGTAGSASYEWRVTDFEGVTGPTANLSALQLGGTAINATAAEINAAADVSARYVAVTDANTSIDAANSGKPHVVADVTADRTFTLPTAASGLDYTFIPKLNAADGHDWIISTGSNTNYIVGGVMHLDTDAGAGADELALVVGNGSSNSKLQVNLPQPGTILRFVCDGTLWVVSGVVCSATAPAFADQ